MICSSVSTKNQLLGGSSVFMLRRNHILMQYFHFLLKGLTTGTSSRTMWCNLLPLLEHSRLSRQHSACDWNTGAWIKNSWSRMVVPFNRFLLVSLASLLRAAGAFLFCASTSGLWYWFCFKTYKVTLIFLSRVTAAVGRENGGLQKCDHLTSYISSLQTAVLVTHLWQGERRHLSSTLFCTNCFQQEWSGGKSHPGGIECNGFCCEWSEGKARLHEVVMVLCLLIQIHFYKSFVVSQNVRILHLLNC